MKLVLPVPILVMLTLPAVSQEIELQWPVACTLGQDCWIQQYVDRDATEAVVDYACGVATYDGHKGTDIRVSTLVDVSRGVDVLAAATGRVKGVRNDMPDHIPTTAEDHAAIKSRECGNGLVLAHGNGWETQYCHMKKGSVAVTPGQEVRAGQVIGQLGYSGKAAFPHLHLAVRKDGKVVDPFGSPQLCGGVSEDEIWADDVDPMAAAALSYQPTHMIEVGFADRGVSQADLVAGLFAEFELEPNSPALVGYVRTINLSPEDQVRLVVTGPDGIITDQTYNPVDRAKARQMYFGGKRLKGARWSSGTYTVTANLLRGGAVRATLTKEISVR